MSCMPGFVLVDKRCSETSRIIRFGSYSRPGPFSLAFGRAFFSRTYSDRSVVFQYQHIKTGLEGLYKLENGELDFCVLDAPVVANAVGRGIKLELVYPTWKLPTHGTGCRVRKLTSTGRIRWKASVSRTRSATQGLLRSPGKARPHRNLKSKPNNSLHSVRVKFDAPSLLSGTRASASPSTSTVQPVNRVGRPPLLERTSSTRPRLSV